MAKRVSIRVGQVFSGRAALVGWLGKAAVLSVGEGQDSDADILTAADGWRKELARPIRHRRVDKAAILVNDKANPSPPSQASG